MKYYFVLVSLLLVSSCSEIKHYENLSKKSGVLQSASIGSELYRVHKQRDLPNVFGKADIHGGKVDEGFTELRFMGLTDNGKIIFRLTDIDIVSNENVFTRYGASRSVISSSSTANATLYGDTAYGSSNTSSTVTHYEKPKARITKLPPNTVEFAFKPSDKVLELDGVNIEIKAVSKYSIKYILHTK